MNHRPAELLLGWSDAIQVLWGDLDRHASLQDFNPRDPEVSLNLASWNALGTVALLLRQPEHSEELFKALLQAIRRWQRTRGRIHKGTPYHQIGRAKLVKSELSSARAYFTYAAVEDIINNDGNVADAMASPASQTLRVQFGYVRGSFERLAEALPQRDDGTRRGRLRFANPELLFLADVPTHEIAERK
jgi:hypothetical protein